MLPTIVLIIALFASGFDIWIHMMVYTNMINEVDEPKHSFAMLFADFVLAIIWGWFYYLTHS